MIIILSLCLNLFGHVVSHGYLDWPPQRSSLWRHGFNTPKNYNDNSLYCGGRQALIKAEGKCGVCGDPFYGRKDNEAGGLYAQGVIAESYPAGTKYIPVTVKLTTHHKGFFEFRICPNNNPNVPVTHECLDRNLLHIQEGDERSGFTRYYPEKHQGVDIYHLHVEIPAGMRCSQCVLNWRYKTGNSWGTDPDGRSCLGCGLQEEFRNCADIRIEGDASSASSEQGLFSDSSSTSGGSEEVYIYNSLDKSESQDIIIDNSLEYYGNSEPATYSQEIVSKEHHRFVNHQITNNRVNNGKKTVLIKHYTSERPKIPDNTILGPVGSGFDSRLTKNPKTALISNKIPLQGTSVRLQHNYINRPTQLPFKKQTVLPMNNHVFLPSLSKIAPDVKVKQQPSIQKVADMVKNRNSVPTLQQNIASQQAVKNIMSSRNLLNSVKAREIFLRLQGIKNMRSGFRKTGKLGVNKEQTYRNNERQSQVMKSRNPNLFLISPMSGMSPVDGLLTRRALIRDRETQGRRPFASNTVTPPNNILILKPPSTPRMFSSINQSARRSLTNALNQNAKNGEQRRSQGNNHLTRNRQDSRAVNSNIVPRTQDVFLRDNRDRQSGRTTDVSASPLQIRRGAVNMDTRNSNLSPRNERNNRMNLNRMRQNIRDSFLTNRRQSRLRQRMLATPIGSQRRAINLSANQQNVQNRRFQDRSSIQRQPFQTALQRRTLNTSPTGQRFVNQRSRVQSLPLSRTRTITMDSQFRGRQNLNNARLLPRQRDVLNTLRRRAFSQNRNRFHTNGIQ